MPRATHFYAYSIRTERPQPRLGSLLTGRFQVHGEITHDGAKKLIADMHHNSLGAFEIVKLTPIQASN